MELDPLTLYIDTINKISDLSPRKFKQLWYDYKEKNDKSAYQKILYANLKLVVRIAKKYSYSPVDMLDLISEGNLGLMRAIKKFDPKKKVKLSTYASYWIEQYIKRAVERYSKVIKIPSHMWESMKKWIRIWESFYNRLGRYPSLTEMAEELHFSIKKLQKLLNALEMSKRFIYLSQPRDENGEAYLENIAPDLSKEIPEKFVSKIYLDEKLKESIKNLSPRERKILELRFGLAGEKYTLEETGEILKLSRERVRQLEKRALYKLKWLACK